MKRLIASTLVAAGLFSAGLAQAAGADLSVKGKLKSGACSVVLGSGGVFDLRSIKVEDLVAQNFATLKPDPIALTITCATATTFGLRLQDNRAGTAVADWLRASLGLGTAGGKKIGTHLSGISNPTSNGRPIDMLQRVGNGSWWNDHGPYIWLYNSAEDLASFTAIGNEHTPVAFAQISALLISEVSIAPPEQSGLDLSQQVQIDGSATLELVYI